MKANINLHNRPNGRIDTYQPYKQQEQQQHRQQSEIVVDRDNRLSAAYSVNYEQACLVLRAIQMNGRRGLSPACISNLATFVARAWEANPSQEKVDALSQLMKNLLDTTLLSPELPFEEALKQFCRNDIATQSVSPAITLLIAIGYIERLKQKYGNIKGSTGCGHRLIMVAYMMAAKFMHVNLRAIINTTDVIAAPASSSPSENLTTEAQNSKYTPTLPPIIISKEQLPSPPTSPKAYSDTDPLKYHYFKAKEDVKLPPVQHLDRHFQILRMELEFLHFLNYDLSLSDTIKLIHWAQKFDDNQFTQELPAEQHYSSGDEGDDELEPEH